MATVQSVDRAFDILEALARGPAGVSDLAQSTGLPKSTVARLLATLEPRNLVTRTGGDVRYRLGGAISELAGAVAPGWNLAGLARPHLVRLTERLGEATGLSVAAGKDVHYLDQVESPNPVQVRDWTGTRIPLHAVPSGVVLLSGWPEPAITEYAARPLERFTPATVTDPVALRAKLAAARADGHAWGREEYAAGITSVAAPVRERSGAVIAAVHAHGPTYRFPPTGDDDHVAGLVVESAIAISERLGYEQE